MLTPSYSFFPKVAADEKEVAADETAVEGEDVVEEEVAATEVSSRFVLNSLSPRISSSSSSVFPFFPPDHRCYRILRPSGVSPTRSLIALRVVSILTPSHFVPFQLRRLPDLRRFCW